MSNTPVDWTLLLVLGLFGLVLWAAARRNASPQVWRWLSLRDKVLSVVLLVVTVILMEAWALCMYLAQAVVGSLLGFSGT